MATAPLKVGSAYAEFYLKTDGLRQGAADTRAILLELKKTSAEAAKGASAIATANDKIARSFRDLKTLLDASDPYAGVTASARDAYIQIVGNSYIPDLVVESTGEIAKLERAMLAAKPFAALSDNAAAEAAETERILDDLKQQAEGMKAAVEQIGIRRDQLPGLFDSEGQIRDSVRMRDSQLAATRKTDQFGRVTSTDEISRRLDDIRRDAPTGTQAGLTEDDESLKDLAVSAREAYQEIDQLQEKIKLLSTSPDRPKAGPIDLALQEARAARAELEETTRATEAAALADQQYEQRSEQLERRYLSLKEAAQRYGETTEDGSRAAYLAIVAQAQLDNHLKNYDKTAHAAEEADEARAAALERVRIAEAALMKQTEAATQATARRQRTQAQQTTAPVAASGTIAAGGPTKVQIAEAEKAARKIQQLELEIERERERAKTASSDRETALIIERERRAAADHAAFVQREHEKAQLEQQRLIQLELLERKIRAQRDRDEERAAKPRPASAERIGPTTNDREIRQAAIEQARLNAQLKDYAGALSGIDRVLAAGNLKESERIRLIRERNRIEKQSEQPTGPSLPRTFAGFTKEGLTELAGVLGIATTAAEAFQAVYNGIAEGNRLRGELDETRRSLGQLINSQDRANRVFDAAAEFGDRYRFTTEEMTGALEALAPQIRNSNLATEKQLEITARLLSRSPKQGFDGAAFSIGELANLDTQSIVERFNLPRQAANRMKEEIKAGADVFQVLDRELTRLGVTAEILDERLKGPTGASRDLKKAAEDLKIALAGLFENDITNGQKWAAETTRSVTRGLDALTFLRKNAKLSDFIPTFEQASQYKPSTAATVSPFLSIIEQAGSVLGIATQNAAKRVDDSAQTIDPALKAIGDRATVLTNQLNEGKIDLAGYADALSKIGQAGQAADTFGIVRGLSELPAPERIERLSLVMESFQNQIGQRPEIAPKILPQLQAIAAEIDRLKRTGPIVITVEMRRQFLSQATPILEETASRAEQLGQQLTDMDRNYTTRAGEFAGQAAKAWSSYLQQRARAAREFGQTEARAARDFTQTEARARRDFRQQQQRAAEEHARSLENIETQLAQRLADIETNKQRRLKQLQGDADVNRERAEEDYNEERLKLLAEGRIFEAEQLKKEFEKEQRRAAEDLTRSKDSTVIDAGTQADDARAQAKQQTDAAIAEYNRQVAEQKKAFDQQRADAAAAYAQQRADARAAYAQQQADQLAAAQEQQAAIKEQQRQEEAAYKQNRAQLLKEFDQYLADQRAKIDEQASIIEEATRRGVDVSIVEQERALKKAEDRLGAALAGIGRKLGSEGASAAAGYMREFATALLFGATEAEKRAARQAAAPRPAPKVDERDQMRQEQNDIQRTRPQSATGISRQLDRLSTDQARTADSVSALQRSQAAPQQRQPVNIQLRVDGPTLDGDAIASKVATRTTSILTDDLAIQLDLTDSSNQPSLQQSAFRQV